MGVDLFGAGYRQLKRVTFGEALAKKQDRAANLAKIAEVLEMRPSNIKTLGPTDFRVCGNRYTVDALRFHVLAEKEAGNIGGFQKDGRMTIMDEPQHFSGHSAHAFDVIAPHLSYPKWIPKAKAHKLSPEWLAAWGKHPHDLSHRERWQLWAAQAELNFDAAVCAISMGRFQVMGFHWRIMNFESPMEMLRYAYESEANQLDLCVRWFVAYDKLDALRRGNWYDVAIYNGTGDRENYARECEAIAAKRKPLYA